MKNSFAKIIGATLGVALAIGVAVGANNKAATELNAATTIGTASFNLGSNANVTNRWAPGKGIGAANSNSTVEEAWAKPSPDDGSHSYTDTMANADGNGQKWTVTYSYTGAYSVSYTGGAAGTANMQFGKASNPPTTLTFVSSAFTKAMVLSSFSCKYGDASNASTIRGSLYYDSTLITTGDKTSSSSNETKTVSYTAGSLVIPAGSALKVMFSDMANGVKIYEVSYTLTEKFTVSYDKNDAGASGTMTDSNSPYNSGSTVTVLANEFTAPTGKQFDHWDTKGDDSGIDYNPDDTFTITANITLYAQWADIPTVPTITLNFSNIFGYTEEAFSVTATYLNLTSAFAWGSPSGTGSIAGSVTASTGNSTDGTSTYSGTLTTAGTVTLTASGGGAENKTVTFTITASAVTITGLAATDAICVGETVDLGSTITVEAVGTFSDDVIWDSEDNSIAEVSATGVVTGISTGTVDITVYAYDDLDVYETCTVTVSESNFIRVNKFQNGKKYIIAAEGNTDSSKLFYLPAATIAVDKNPAASLIESFADLTEVNCWTATVTLVEGVRHIVFSNTYETTTYYLVATDTAQGIKIVTAPEEGYWTFDGTGLRYSDGGSRYMYTYNDGSFRYYDAEGTGRSLADVFYKYSPSGTAKKAIETNLDTRFTLRYNYGNANDLSTYSNVAIRFGGLISQDLWESLDAESGIQGYGVILSTAAYLDGFTIKELYDDYLSTNGGDVDDTMDDLCDGTYIKDFYTSLTSKGASHPDEANAAQKGSLVGTYYVWNLYKHVMDSAEGLTESQIKQKLMREYTAIAYIKTTNDGIVFLDETTASVKSIAQAMIDDDTNDLTGESYEGSLGKLAGLTA